jgi:ribosomal-protein-alanine N-acetyltransferase
VFQHPQALSDGTISLRELSEQDIGPLVQIFADPEVRDRNRVPAATATAVARWLRQTRRETAREQSIHFGIYDGSTRELVGRIGLWFDAVHRRATIGFLVSSQRRRQGLATRAVRLVTTWAFQEQLIDRISGSCDLDNVASRKTMEAAGFQKEGILKSYYLTNDGARRDQYCFSLLNPSPLRTVP